MQRIPPESSRDRQRRIRAEAVVWVARLRGKDRKAIDREWFKWLAADPEHVEQFKIVLQECVRKSRAPGVKRPRQGARRTILSCLTVILLIGITGTVFYWMPTTLRTRMGERLEVTLADGTQVELNTETHVAVDHDVHRREIDLRSGEVYLNLTQYKPHLFVVVAGDHRVITARASFVVRRDNGSATPLTVTLIEGCVAIVPVRAPESPLTRSVSEATFLNAGERVQFRRDGAMVVDRPPLNTITSWRDGKLSFVDTPLADAVREFNRYNLQQISVGSPEAGSIRINGTFETDEWLDFIRTIEQAHQDVRLRVQGDQVILESILPGG
jgi:transmembrane sensor